MEEGFKNTEVGDIPEDWEVKALDKEIDLITGFPFQSAKFVKNGVRLLRGSNVKRGVTDWSEDNTKFWEDVSYELKQYLLKEGDVVIAMDGSLVGKSFARITKNDLPALLVQRIARVRSNKIDEGYLKEFICSDYFTKHCDNVKTASAIPHISPKDIRSFQIPIPPTKAEQTAIATALNDADALITQLEKLISKKKAIKQGAMQELLKPKEGWEEKKLGDFAFITKLAGFEYSLHFNSYKDQGDIIVVRGTNITHNKLDLTDVKTIPTETSKKLLRSKLYKNDLVFAYVGTIGPIYLVLENDRFHLGPNTAKITVNSELDSHYLYHYFTSLFIKEEIKLHTSIGAQPSLSMTKIREFRIFLPPTISHQIAIAQTLSDMDLEIEKLETKLEKLKQIKQGMMQSLLTGKIRLV